jgi:hypothetical protein
MGNVILAQSFIGYHRVVSVEEMLIGTTELVDIRFMVLLSWVSTKLSYVPIDSYILEQMRT